MKQRFLAVVTLLMFIMTCPGYAQNLSALMDAINSLEKKLTKLIGQETVARKSADRKMQAGVSGKSGGAAKPDSAVISAVEELKKALSSVQSTQSDLVKQFDAITATIKELQAQEDDARVKEMAADLKTLVDELKAAMNMEGAKAETEGEAAKEEAAADDTKTVSFSGYLDSDVWTDFAGSFYTNDELDLGMSVAFSDKVSANVYMTVLGGAIPAGGGEPGDRWVSILFDGVDITFDTKIGSFSVGDLVYQYGGFNYYLYKRKSMITPESFSRGVQYTYTGEKFSQSILAAAADDADELFSYHVASIEGDTVEVEGSGVSAEGNGAHIVGTSCFSINDNHSLGVFYGIKADVQKKYKAGGLFFAGFEYTGAIAEILELKLDFGHSNFTGDYNVIILLFEPLIRAGKFSTALTFYTLIDPDSANDVANDPLFGVGDELFVYLEPGYSFTDYFAAGLPLEYHSFDVEETEDDEFWIVPTLYVYPFDCVEWWIWGLFGVPFAKESDTYYGFGSEIIVNF